jgi:hypothetical protein
MGRYGNNPSEGGGDGMAKTEDRALTFRMNGSDMARIVGMRPKAYRELLREQGIYLSRGDQIIIEGWVGGWRSGYGVELEDE